MSQEFEGRGKSPKAAIVDAADNAVRAPFEHARGAVRFEVVREWGEATGCGKWGEPSVEFHAVIRVLP
jgi:hypothetical protein